MIKILNELPTTAFNNALCVKICSLYNAYGVSRDFCTFWTQINGDNEITAIICKFYSAITLCALNDANIQELNEFFDIVGYTEIQSNVKLNKDGIEFDSVYLKSSGNQICDFSVNIEKAKACYSILNQYPDEISLGQFDEWYVDISHRIRHKSAFIINNINSTALCLIGKNEALLSGIAVDTLHKSNGMGRELINQICNLAISGIFAICSKKNLGFYLNLGFKPQQKIYYYKGQY